MYSTSVPRIGRLGRNHAGLFGIWIARTSERRWFVAASHIEVEHDLPYSPGTCNSPGTCGSPDGRPVGRIGSGERHRVGLRYRFLPEWYTLGKHFQRSGSAISVVERNGVAPPRLYGVLPNISIVRILQDEEDQDGGNGHSRVQCGGKNIWDRQPLRELSRQSDGRDALRLQLYFVHHEKWRRRMT